MGADQNLDWRAAAASALEWWRDAGVDVLVDEDARDWLAPAAPAGVPATAAFAAGDAMPDAWEAFLAWRAGPGSPEAAWHGPRIVAEGPVGAPLMVLVDQPDRADCQAGRLLSGDDGRLFDRMLAAIGLTRDAIHLATVCGARTPAGRIAPEDEARLHPVARRHVALAAPQKLLLLGNAATRALLATDCMAARGRWHVVNHEAGQVGAVTSFHPRLLLDQPGRKAAAWRDLQLLIGTPA
jgi:uracil-DNA glycosylase